MSTAQVREVREIAEQRGWAAVERTANNHLRLRHENPEVELVFTGTTSSDRRWRENLISQMRQAEREAGLEVENGALTKVREARNEAPTNGTPTPVEGSGRRTCQYCGAGPFEDGRGRAAHERSCDENPDRWLNCRYCSKPCEGPSARGNHERQCPERPEAQEEPPIKAEAPAEPTGAPRPRRAAVRGVLVDLIREYDALHPGPGGDVASLLESMLDLNATIETSTDLLIEMFDADPQPEEES